MKINFVFFMLLMGSLWMCNSPKSSKDDHHTQHQSNTDETKSSNSESSSKSTSTEISTGDCIYCGMPVVEFPKWQTSILTDKEKMEFCSPRCLFIEYLEQKDKLQDTKVLVTDYYDLEKIDGRTAFFVIKSDVLGPMGHDLVPFKTKADAENFQNDHQGQKILAFQEVTMEIIQELVNQ